MVETNSPKLARYATWSVLAIVLLGEQHELTPRFYLGVAIVLLVVVAYPFLARRRSDTPAAPVEHPQLMGTAEAKQIVD